MGNILTILKRDWKRLIRVPAAWVIIFGIVVIPALYAWFNIYGFWDPYNKASDIAVAVANEDKGTDSSAFGKLDLGDEIVAKLKDNHGLGWRFESQSDAMRCVRSSECYAAIVIPSDFSSHVADILNDPSSKPQLEYYVNEKANAVAPKITDVGATTVDREVNSAFVSTVSSVLTDKINETDAKLHDSTDTTIAKAVSKLNDADKKLDQAGRTMSDLMTKLDEIPGKTAQARTALTAVSSAAVNAGNGLSSAQKSLDGAQKDLNTFTSGMNGALDKGSSLIGDASTQASGQITQVTAALTSASGYTGSALSTLQQVNSSNASLLAELKGITLSDATLNTQLQAIISKLDTANQQTATALNDLSTLNTDTKNAAESTGNVANSFNAATQNSLTAIGDARSAMNSSSLPQLNSSLTSLSATSGLLSNSATGATALVDQTKTVLDQLDSVSASTSQALQQTRNLVGTLQGKISNMATDLQSLTSSNTLSSLLGTNGALSAANIASFMMSPTVLKTTTLYPVNSYGSGMAPLFTSLSMWVGCFMIMVLFKLEVDDEGLDKRYVTAGQKYLARFLLLAPIALLQGLVVTIGDLVIGVQTVNAAMFVLTGVLGSLFYLSICYMLSTTFQQIGKGLIIVLVMVQIPGASGLYPIEMMPRFFRELYPFFPFSHAISAFRETIGGFYDGTWTRNMIVLLIFAILAFITGLVLRPLMTNMIRLFARETKETDLINGETVYLPNRRYSATMALEALSDNATYRRHIMRRAANFAELYPRLLRGALIAGVIVPIILFVVFSMVNDGRKIVALAAWCIWLLIIITFLMVVEYIRDSLDRQTELSGLSSDVLANVLYQRTKQRSQIRSHKRALKLLKKEKKEGRHAA